VNFQGRHVSWKVVGTVLGPVALSVLPVIRSGNLAGTSKILVVAYAGIWAFVFLRVCIHLYEGYLRKGLWWETLLELSTLVFWGLLVVIAIRLANPQIVRLAAFAAVASALLLVSFTVLERARGELTAGEDGVRIRRATKVIKESWTWGEACDLFGRLNTRPTEKLRDWVSGDDPDDGLLSRAGIFALCAVVSLAVTAGSLTIVGTIVGMQLTAPGKTSRDKQKSDGHGQDSEDNTGGAAGTILGGDSPKGDRERAFASSPASDCGFDYDPGPRVSEPERSSLMLVWHQVDGIVPGLLEALGSDIAGCPGPAWPISGKPGWWYATGYCKGSLRSIGIAPAGAEHPVVLLEQAAEFASPLIKAGKFEDAVDRFTVGDGDAYVIDAAAGSYVLIRIHSTGGSVARSVASDGCNNFANRDVAYTIVPPALIPGWRSVAAISSGGVYPISAAHHSGDLESFVFVSDAGIEAEGRCWHEGAACSVEIEGVWITGGPALTDQREVEALAEP
jgi:hypothetical protein